MTTSIRREILLLTLMTSLAAMPTITQFPAAYGQQPPAPPDAKGLDSVEFTPRGQRIAKSITYGDWQKLCFKPAGANAVCRTTITGTFETGQTAVRLDVIEREGEQTARLQLFLPVGVYLQSGVGLTVDQGASYKIPYVWCLSNACIAADVADNSLLKEMETGQRLLVRMVDINVLSVTTEIPLKEFASTRLKEPAKIFEQTLDE